MAPMKKPKYLKCLKEKKGSVKGKGQIQKLCGLEKIDRLKLSSTKTHAPILLLHACDVKKVPEKDIEKLVEMYPQNKTYRMDEKIKEYNTNLLLFEKRPQFLTIDRINHAKQLYLEIMKENQQITKIYQAMWERLKQLGLKGKLKARQSKNQSRS